jgi:hypothetical protein
VRGREANNLAKFLAKWRAKKEEIRNILRISPDLCIKYLENEVISQYIAIFIDKETKVKRCL